ncbi:DUF2986 domain-containing protein [Vibrio sp. RC27]
MNRKKKINETLKKRLKKQNAKLHKSNKPKYISKAEREKMAQQESESIESLESDASQSE